ncbi:MAG: DNA-binding GntR family transcriptional regulator, partial [Cellvibrionaceae bacterium]
GELESGQPLREKEVSDWFRVSRGPVREVFQLLAQEGMLVAEPNKGVKVAQKPSGLTRDLLVKLRVEIETFVLDNIFDQITDEDIAQLESILANIKTACDNNDMGTLLEHDLHFHRTIIQSHDEKDLFSIWQPMALRMLIQYNRLGDLMESHQEHKEIFDAIRDKDKGAALKALKNNIR